MSTVHPPILESRLVAWPDEAACRASAAVLAARPALREACVELHGALGAGKTTFVRHLLHALGVVGRVKSPTYAVMEPYTLAGGDAWHFDFYRFDDPQEWEDAGFRDVYAAPGLKLAEWPDKAAGLLPVADLRIEIAVEGGEGDDRDGMPAAAADALPVSAAGRSAATESDKLKQQGVDALPVSAAGRSAAGSNGSAADAGEDADSRAGAGEADVGVGVGAGARASAGGSASASVSVSVSADADADADDCAPIAPRRVRFAALTPRGVALLPP